MNARPPDDASQPGVLGLLRPELRAIHHYVSVRPLGTHAGQVYLDANENPFTPLPHGAMGGMGQAYNRYPEAQPQALRSLMHQLFGCAQNQLVITRGSDEAIDLVVRAFCRAYSDAVLVTPPTFAIYRQAALVQGAEVIEAPLNPDDPLNSHVDAILRTIDRHPHVKVVFVCRPNNPLGIDIDRDSIVRLCEALRDRAVVVCDEAYVDFAEAPSVVSLVDNPHDNLLVLRTLSKAYGLAGVRVGCAIAHQAIAQLLQSIGGVYPVSRPSIDAVLCALTPQGIARKRDQIRTLVRERERMRAALVQHPSIRKVLPSAANFLLVVTNDAKTFCANLLQAGIVVRPRDAMVSGAVRISIGTPVENDLLLQALGLAVEDAPRVPVREVSVTRATNETQIEISVNLDDATAVAIDTGVPFFDHMLEQVAKHGGLGLRVHAKGDLEIDPHHTIEDVALVLGQALRKALGDGAGMGRFGFTAPMDDALATVSVDLGGRPFCAFEATFPEPLIGTYPTGMTAHVFRSLATALGANIHAVVRGDDAHHMVEALFKALGLALKQAVRRSGQGVPSTKGVL